MGSQLSGCSGSLSGHGRIKTQAENEVPVRSTGFNRREKTPQPG